MARFLGFIDILAGIIFVASSYGLDAPRGLVLSIGIILILKGVLFISNFFSWIDIAVGVILIFGLVTSLPSFSPLIIAAFLGLKGLFSLFSF
jgi:hypothetical protein